MSERDLGDTRVDLTNDEYHRLCVTAFENLPTDTAVTMEDLDAIFTWCLPEYDRLKAAREEEAPS
ncbi:hypothetical protein AB0J52_17900 [Spirillospora sp. NPDC049652]